MTWGILDFCAYPPLTDQVSSQVTFLSLLKMINDEPTIKALIRTHVLSPLLLKGHGIYWFILFRISRCFVTSLSLILKDFMAKHVLLLL